MENAKTVFDGMEVEDNAALKRFKNDDKLVLELVKSIETKEFEYKDGKTGKKKVYTLLDGTQYVVPFALHNKIVSVRKEYGTKIAAVKIKVTGSGLETRYDALPVI